MDPAVSPVRTGRQGSALQPHSHRRPRGGHRGPCGGFEITASLWHFTIPALSFPERQRLASLIQGFGLTGDRVRVVQGDGDAVVIETHRRELEPVRGPRLIGDGGPLQPEALGCRWAAVTEKDVDLEQKSWLE